MSASFMDGVAFESSPVRSTGMAGSAAGSPYRTVRTDLNHTVGMDTFIHGTGAPQEDGRQFFHDLKAAVSADQFRRFTASIKSLNLNQCTKQDTLSVARDLFGTQHPDLYERFQRLIAAAGSS